MMVFVRRLQRILKSIVFEPTKAFERIRYRLGVSDGPLGRALYRRVMAQVAPHRLFGQSSDEEASLTQEQKSLAFSKGLQVAFYDSSLQQKQPLFLLLNGRAALAQSLAIGVARGDISALEARCFLDLLYENPVRELIRTWYFSEDWQNRYPDGVTVFGRQAFAQWLRLNYKLPESWLNYSSWPLDLNEESQIRLAYFARPQWQAMFPQALKNKEQSLALLRYICVDESCSQEARLWCSELDCELISEKLVQAGVNVLGHFSYPSGLRSSTEAIVSGLNQVGVLTTRRNVRVDLRRNDPVHHLFNGLELFDTSIIHVQPEPFMGRAYVHSGLNERIPRTYRIGYWYWEFDSVPDSWKSCSPLVDEIWTANEFIAKGLREKFSQPVNVFMPGLALPQFDRKPREYFNLPNDKFIFSFVFHMSSVMERKNPLALIAAFKQAFSIHDDALLVIKASFGEQHPVQLAELRAAAQGHSIVVIDDVFTLDETLSLINCSDAYVSLHRSEGLGLTMAEAMLLGKPVIATRYSGNLEFMNESNSLLVDMDLISLDKDYPPYKKGMRWANPSVEHASKLMRQLYDNPQQAVELGAFAQRDVNERFSHQAVGERMRDRLDFIQKRRTIE